MRTPAPLAALLLAPALGVMLGCGAGTAPPSPTPTPFPASLLRERYLAAANAYDAAEGPVAQAESSYCVATAAGADLTRCEAALSSDREATIAFDNAVRQIEFPAAARPAVTQLLNDDAQLETLLLQASTAPSLSAIATLTAQIFQLLTASSNDADAVRRDIGLPVPSPSAPPAPPVPAASPSTAPATPPASP